MEYTNGSLIAPEAPVSVTLVPRFRRSTCESLPESSRRSGGWLSQEWTITRVLPTPPRARIPWRGVSDCVHDFVDKVASFEAIQCVVAEEVEPWIIHITTFGHPLDEETRQKVYAVELELVRTNPNLEFDFHLRDAVEAGRNGIRAVAANGHYFGIWGALDAGKG